MIHMPDDDTPSSMQSQWSHAASCEGARGAWGCSPVEQFSQLPPAVLRITTLSKIAWLSAYGVLQ